MAHVVENCDSGVTEWRSLKFGLEGLYNVDGREGENKVLLNTSTEQIWNESFVGSCDAG